MSIICDRGKEDGGESPGGGLEGLQVAQGKEGGAQGVTLTGARGRPEGGGAEVEGGGLSVESTDKGVEGTKGGGRGESSKEGAPAEGVESVGDVQLQDEMRRVRLRIGTETEGHRLGASRRRHPKLVGSHDLPEGVPELKASGLRDKAQQALSERDRSDTP